MNWLGSPLLSFSLHYLNLSLSLYIYIYIYIYVNIFHLVRHKPTKWFSDNQHCYSIYIYINTMLLVDCYHLKLFVLRMHFIRFKFCLLGTKLNLLDTHSQRGKQNRDSTPPETWKRHAVLFGIHAKAPLRRFFSVWV